MAHIRAWDRLAAPGAWLDGFQRVQTAAEVRAAAIDKMADSGVPRGRLLFDFAEAAVANDLAAKRDAVTATLGEAAMVDAAGTIAIFQAVVRIADATGTQLEEAKAEISAEFRKKLGLNAFAAG